MKYYKYLCVPSEIDGNEFIDFKEKRITMLLIPNYTSIDPKDKRFKSVIIYNTLYHLYYLQERDKWTDQIFLDYMTKKYRITYTLSELKDLSSHKDIKHSFRKKRRFYIDHSLIMKNHNLSYEEAKQFARIKIMNILSEERKNKGVNLNIQKIIEFANRNDKVIDFKIIEAAVPKIEHRMIEWYMSLLKKKIEPTKYNFITIDKESKFYRITKNRSFKKMKELNNYLLYNGLKLDRSTLKKYNEKYKIIWK